MPGREMPVRSLLSAVAVFAVALLLRFALWPILGPALPYTTFYACVMVSAWLGGLAAGLLATLLSVVAVAILFLERGPSSGVISVADAVGAVLFVVFGVLISWIVEQMHRARTRAEEQRSLVQQTLASIGDAVIATSRSGRIGFMNPVAEDLTGWTTAEAKGQPIHKIFVIENESTGAPVTNPVDQVLEEGKIVGLADNAVVVARDGRRTPIDDRAAPIRDEAGKLRGAVVVFRDVTERKASEQRLLQTEQRLRLLAEANVIGICTKDILSGRVIEANDEYLRILRRTREELNAGFVNWAAATPREHLEFERNLLAQGSPGAMERTYEKEYLRPDGSRVPVMIGFALLEPERTSAVAFVVDLSKQKRAEAALQRINEDLQLFTYGASHDLKEPLRVVASYSRLLRRRLTGKLDPDTDEFLGYIESGVTQMSSLVDALLEYSRAGEVPSSEIGSVSAEEALEQSLTSLRVAIEESRAEIQADRLPHVLIDELHLIQLFQNLIGNSIKYRSEAPPRIRIWSEGRDVMNIFYVSDNGMGIPPEHQDKVFNAFQRLHGRELSGTGLGLATCKRICERYGGLIWVESAGKGQGATFGFTLPAATAASRGASD